MARVVHHGAVMTNTTMTTINTAPTDYEAGYAAAVAWVGEAVGEHALSAPHSVSALRERAATKRNSWSEDYRRGWDEGWRGAISDYAQGGWVSP